MSTYKQCKRTLAAHKGYYGTLYKSFTSLLNQDPPPSVDAVHRSYTKLQDRYDKVFAALDTCNSALEEDSSIAEDAKENTQKELLKDR